MAPEQLRQALRKRPFEPFRVHTANGAHYDVTSPDRMIVMRVVSGIGVPGRSGDAELLVTVSNEHVTRLEPLDDGTRFS